MADNITKGANILDFTIQSNSGGGSVDCSLIVQEYKYYESVLSNSYTASAVIVETGNGGNEQGTLDSLPIRGGELSTISIEDNQGGSINVPLYVNRVNNGAPGTQSDRYTIDFASQEYFSNELTRVVKRYEGKISDHVNSVLTEVLQTKVPLDIDDTSLDYNFIGNDRKPFYTCTWLASKSVPAQGVGDAAGFLFFQTRDGFHFKSIDTIFGQGQPVKKYTYNNTGTRVEGSDGEIISYTIDSDTDLSSNLRLGTYNNRSVYFDFYAMNYRVVDYNIDEQSGGAQVAGKKGSQNFVAPEFIQGPSRIMTNVFDIGNNPQGTGDAQLENWKSDPENPNYKAEETMVQSMMRYNQLFTVKTNIVVSGDLTIKAGDLIECDFPELSSGNPTNFNEESGGIYMVADICHKITPSECLTSMGLIRDSYGKKGGF